MTLAYLPRPVPPTAAVRRRLRNGCPAHLAVLSHPPLRARERQHIPDGHPQALSWEVTPWEDDDRAWYAVAHQGELEPGQVAELLGVSVDLVRDIEESALRKLSALPDELTGPQLARAFAVYDQERHRARDESERARVEQLMAEFMGAAE